MQNDNIDHKFDEQNEGASELREWQTPKLKELNVLQDTKGGPNPSAFPIENPFYHPS